MNMRFRGNGSRGGQGAGLIGKIPKRRGTQMKFTIAVEGGTKNTAFACKEQRRPSERTTLESTKTPSRVARVAVQPVIGVA
jgi:hypothetical protein